MKQLLYSLTLLGGLVAAAHPVGAQQLNVGNTSALTQKLNDQNARNAAIQRKFDSMGHEPISTFQRGGGLANDDCDGAIALTVGATCVPTTGSSAGATQSMDPDTCSGFISDTALDVWYSFVATTTTSYVEATGLGTDSTGFDPVLLVYSGPCVDIALVDCIDATLIAATEVLQLTTVIGNTYYIRIYAWDYADPSQETDFTVCVREPAPPPANDDCANAQAMQVETTCMDIPGSTDSATESMAPDSCNGFISPSALDVWYSFVAVGASTTVQVTGGAGFDAVLMVYDGTCSALTVIGCDDSTTGGGVETAIVPTTVGTTYYYRIYNFGAASGQTAFDFTTCVFETPPAPVNDLCEDVTPGDLAVGSSLTFTGTNIGAQDSEGLGDPNVWEAFTTTECADVVIDYCGTNPAFANGFTALHIGCPSTGTITATSFNGDDCGDGNFSLYYIGLPAGTYYYAVMLDTDPASLAEGPYTLNVTASACAAAPVNDDCTGSTLLTVGSSCVSTTATATGATQSLAPETCTNFTAASANDVWFSFVATSASTTIEATGNGDATAGFDPVLAVYNGDCATGTLISCIDTTLRAETETLTITTVPGTTYYYRVYYWPYAAGQSTDEFTTCVWSNIIGIDEINGSTDLVLFPNPGTGVITLRTSNVEGPATVEVLDVTGRIVYTENTRLNASLDHTMDMTAMAAGNYNVRVTANGVRTTQRLVIK